jgi:hypothetical protein
MSEICDVVKAKNLKIFPNSIIIKIKGGLQLFLTSFLRRDDCYGLILKYLRKSRQFDHDSESSESSQYQPSKEISLQ